MRYVPYVTFLNRSRNLMFIELRIEWCKARARCHRWQEECLLLAEEMRRVKAFFQWEASMWDGRRSYATKKHGSYVIDFSNKKTPIVVQQMYHRQQRIVDIGRICYAARQADTRLRMLKSFRARWGTLEPQLKMISMDSEKMSHLPPELRFSATCLAEMVFE